MAFPYAMAIGAAGSLLGGALGGLDSRSRAKQQRNFMRQGIWALEAGRDALNRRYDMATPYMDRLVETASGLKEELLGQTDPILAAQVRRIRQERQQQDAMMQQQLAARGIDSFTTRVGAQQSVRQAGSNALNDLNARMAAQRQAAIGAGTSAELGALTSRAQFDVNRGRDIAGIQAQIANVYGQQQVAPSTVGQDVGNFTSMLLDAALMDFGVDKKTNRINWWRD